ncbi:hypothetical protein [Metaclostridioides mangenotii]|uniref:Uncharacterized membrane-anchored protein YhcB (DUF1043 family) n=2 Tax=Metaclostridioides mangenotii TaxID=1540 RepID=A0ABS4ECU0_9FIRM|nr:hypothetical protein [Clostridioides mangenotii]MBP1855747.1 uncharacterized membrane-anchored protein YhcB (DUF1043 family) [Clostridioides mangenotii]
MNIILTDVILLIIGVIIGGLLEYRYKRLYNIEVEKTTKEVIELKEEIKKYVEKIEVLQ